MDGYKHRPMRIVAIVAVVVLFGITALFNALSAIGPESSGGLFVSTTGDVSDKLYVEITPAGWTFSIWGIIYTYQVLWIIYGLSTICRKGIDGYLYCSPNIMPVSLYVVYCFNLVFNTTWIFVWDREILIASPIIAACMAGTIYICLIISYRAVYKNIPIMAKNGKMYELWLIRGFVQNGLAFYGTWVTVATCLNIAISTTYLANYPQQNACTISLSILCAVIVGYFILETFVFDKYVRYTVTPYIVLLWALGGSLAKNYVSGKVNSIFTLFLISLVGFLFIVKLVVLIIRHFRSPIKPTLVSDSQTVLAGCEKTIPGNQQIVVLN